MNSIRFYNVRSLRRKGELSLKIFPGRLARRHRGRAVWGETNRAGSTWARDSEVWVGHYGMVGDGMDGKVADMPAWGELRKNYAGHRRELQLAKGIVSRRSRSPHMSNDSGTAKPGGAKGGRKVDAQNLRYEKKTKQ